MLSSSFFALFALLAGARPSAEPREIAVHSDRITLADVSPTAPRELLDLDIGPAPAGGKHSLLSREAVRAALRRAGADENLANGLPARQVVTRVSMTLGTDVLETQIRHALGEKIPEGLSIDRVFGLHPVTVPSGEWTIDVVPTRIQRHTRIRATVLVGGTPIVRLSPSALLSGTAKTPTLRSDLPRGAIVTEDDVAFAQTELASLPTHVVRRRGDLVGKQLQQPGRAGAPVGRVAVKEPPMISRGAPVRLVIVSRGLRIARTGTAQDEGNLNDTIRVKPTGEQSVLRGRIDSAGEVRVEIGSFR